MVSSMPLAVSAPPKNMAQRMSQTVFIMPFMPRVAMRLASRSLDVSKLVLPYRQVMIPLKRLPSPMAASASLWKMMAKTTANRVLRNSVMAEGILRAISSPVANGTRSSQGDM